MNRLTILLFATLLAACPADDKNAAPNGSTNNTANNGSTNNTASNANAGTNNAATNNAATNNAATNNAATNNAATNNAATNNGSTNNGTNNGNDPVVVIENEDCYEFSDDVDIPLAIDGAFDANSQVWRRAHDESNMCPAEGLLPETAALTPYIAFRFCNADAVDHLYDFELLGMDGPGGEPPLDDAYLVIYQGENLPADHTQCLAINDDIEGAIDAGDSEILGLNVPAGETVIVIATTYTFDPTDGTGTGGYVLVVSNAD